MVRDGFYVLDGGSFDLCQVSAKITDHIGTFVIWRKALESASAFAARAGASLYNDEFS